MSESFIRYCKSSAAILLVGAGCMHPGYGPQPYPPMYAPPGQYSAPPGSLIIPESNAPPYEPGSGTSTYEDPRDSFDRPNGQDSDGGVPQPRQPGDSNGPFFEDFSTDATPSGSTPYITTVSSTTETPAATGTPAATSTPGTSYGFARHGYQWLQGTLSHDQLTDSWSIVYNPRADDAFKGRLTLQVDEASRNVLQDNLLVHVRGAVDESQNDALGRPVYRTASVFEVNSLAGR
ncbi:MAG: hypothetical protein KDA85_16250 [Planctomycetaceae bacterium]|nr:hypothetical protein [Planctomycetaceae bacterium]